MGDAALKLLTARDLADRTGKSVRYFQKLAASRKIDWASQPGGEDTAWFFQEIGFERWLAAGCKKAGGKWQTSTGAARSSTGARRTRGRSTGNPLKQRLEQLLKSGFQSGSSG